MERFSKVTHFLKDAFLGQNDLIPTNENFDTTNTPDMTTLADSYDGNLRESNNDGFEVIYKVRRIFLVFISGVFPMLGGF